MTGLGASGCRIDPARAGCCAHVLGTDSGVGTGCYAAVAWVGTIRIPSRIAPVTAFACGERKHLVADPVRYGTNPRHVSEMVRRRRDRWQRQRHTP